MNSGRAARTPWPVLVLCSVFVADAVAASPPLYATGPSQDLAVIRFVNADAKTLVVRSDSGAELSIAPESPIGDFQFAGAQSRVTGQWRQGAKVLPISLQLKAGGATSLVAWTGGDGDLTSLAFVESKVPFDPLKASLAFYNADAACPGATLLVADKSTTIFENQAVATVARRAVNPTRVSVRAACADRSMSTTLDLGSLQAGQHYSVFLVPSSKGPMLIAAQDRFAP